ACRSGLLPALLLVDVSAIDPHLDADLAVGGFRFAETVIDIGPQRVQRQTSLQIPLGACDFVAVQPARDANLDPFATETQRRVDALAHGAAKADALLKLKGDVLGYELRIELRLVDLDDVDKHVAVGALAQLRLELLNLRALAADHDAGTRGADDEAQLVAGALDLYRTHAGGLQLVAQLGLELHVLDKELVVVALREPA